MIFDSGLNPNGDLYAGSSIAAAVASQSGIRIQVPIQVEIRDRGADNEVLNSYLSTSMTQYGFYVNSDACSGCKTCQVACKDRNNLAAGVHWRRVYEITAGNWERKAGAWIPNVSAYNLSVACHHCLVPVCAAVCTPLAIWKREDGLVFIDDSRCTRCLACRAACPYGAIRSDPVTAVSKCHLCPEDLAANRPPACVSACPNRALDFGEFEDLKKKYAGVSRIFPLPDPSTTQPALVIKPHRNAALVQNSAPEVSNWEEI